MMIAIAVLSMVLGFFLGYKVGFNRCMQQFTTSLELLRKQLVKNADSLREGLEQ